MRPPQRGGKPFAMPPPQGPQPINKMPNQYGPHGPPHMQQLPHHPHQPHMQGHPQGQQYQQGPPGMSQKRELIFPPDTVESTQPMLYRRKRMTKHDIGPVDPWRIFMSLRSGLLAESTWALDVLNVLLYDDSAIAYFGLVHLPGLLNLLLEHFQKSLADMFETKTMTNVAAITSDEECNKTGGDNNELSSNLISNSDTGDTRCNKHDIHMPANREEENSSVDLGAVTDIPNPNEHLVVLKSTFNYTLQSRKGVPVKMQDSSNDIFVMDNHRDWDKISSHECFLRATVNDDPFNVGQEPNAIEYIMNSFKAEYAHIPFARYIKNVRNGDGSEKIRKPSEQKPSAVKRMRLSSEEEREVEEMTKKLHHVSSKQVTNNNNVVKKDSNPDADCRQVDMELEKLTNGPAAENGVAEKEIKSEKEEIKDEEEDLFNVRSTLRDPAKSLKRLRVDDYEDECYTRDEASLHLITDSQDSLARRCVCLSTILRNLTFVPGNELEFARSTTFLSIIGKLLLLNHEHPIRTKKQRNYDREEDADFSDSCSSLQGESEWWWEFLVQIRENMLVSIANISGYLDLSVYDEPVSRPVLDGLLHWAVCPSAHGQDPFSPLSNSSMLSPQRLALESLCKLCVTDSNVDLVIATPPFSRLEKLCAVLTKHLCKNEDQVLREFSVNLLHYLASSDSAMARTVAKQSPCVSYLVAFIEQAEQTALGVANQHGINFLRENPDSMGTSLDMLRRAAGTLLHLAKHPDNRPLFMQQEQRLLGLVMSHILDQQVALIVSRVLYQTSRGSGPLTTTQQIEQSSESSAPKTAPEVQKDSVSLPPPMPEQKQPLMNAPSLPHVPASQFTQMKSPAIPPPSFPPAPSKLLNSSDDTVKSKLNTINKQLPNATNIATTTAPTSAPAIPQTVTASS
jgi:AT-rich interactive domain-containing protein 1